MIDLAPEPPVRTPDEVAGSLAGRTPTFGEAMGASLREGWWNTPLGVAQSLANRERETARDATPLSREEWQASGYARPGLSWGERMTRGRAEAMARTFDDNAYRRQVMAARDAGVLETVAGFGAQMLGTAADPTIFIPFAGPITRGARFGATALEGTTAARALAGTAAVLSRPGIGGSALRGAVDATVGTAAFAPLVYAGQAEFGDEATLERFVTDLALGAVVGSVFGTAAGILGRAAEARQARMVADPVASARVLGAAAQDVADGRGVDLPPDVIRQASRQALRNSAPAELDPFIQAIDAPGGPFAALPRRADGSPLSREEFGALMAEREQIEAATRVAEAEPVARAPEAEQPPRAVEAAPDEQAPAFGEQAAEPPSEAPRRAVETSAPVERAQPAAMASPEQVRAERQAATDEAFAWYERALAVEARLSQLAPGVRDDVLERAGIMEDAGMSRAEATVRAADDVLGAEPRAEADPEMEAAQMQVEALRAEGRVTAADEAVLRAGDDAAAELEAMANGLESAAACILRNAT